MNRKLFLLASLLIVSGCTSHPIVDTNADFAFQYPLAIGNQWVYLREWTLQDVETGETQVLGRATDTCAVIRAEVLDGWNTFVLEQRYAEPRYDVLRSENWYANRSNGVFACAYRSVGGSGQPEPGRDENRSGSLLCQPWLGFPSAPSIHNDSLHRTTPPRLVLSYPPIISSRWVYVLDSEIPFRIEKTILGKWKVYLPVGTFDCYVVRWEYFDYDSGLKLEISMTDYISSIGLVKREIEWYESGVNDGWVGLYLDTYTLQSYSISSND